MDDATARKPACKFLRYACVESGAGRLLVVMTDRGVVDVILGDDQSELLDAALARFPGSALLPDDGTHAEWVGAVVKRIETHSATAWYPVDCLTPRDGFLAAG